MTSDNLSALIARLPLTRAAQLADLDDAEVIEGYREGRAGEPEPGNNRSFSFWHGWRNGASDAGHREIDAAQAALVHDVVRGGRCDCGQHAPTGEHTTT